MLQIGTSSLSIYLEQSMPARGQGAGENYKPNLDEELITQVYSYAIARTSAEGVHGKITTPNNSPNVTNVHCIDKEIFGLAYVAYVNMCVASKMHSIASAVVGDRLKEQGNKAITGHVQAGNGGGNQPINLNQFPQISNNFVKQIIQSKQDSRNPCPFRVPNNQNSQQFLRKCEDQEPAPYTVIQTYAAKLRCNLPKTTAPILFDTPKITTKQGRLAVIFSAEDFLVKWTGRCKDTLIGKFSYAMRKVELL